MSCWEKGGLFGGGVARREVLAAKSASWVKKAEDLVSKSSR